MYDYEMYFNLQHCYVRYTCSITCRVISYVIPITCCVFYLCDFAISFYYMYYNHYFAISKGYMYILIIIICFIIIHCYYYDDYVLHHEIFDRAFY